MTTDCSKNKSVLIDMAECVYQLKEDFSETLEKNAKAWNDKLFPVDKKSKMLCSEKSEIFYSFLMKIMFYAREVGTMLN